MAINGGVAIFVGRKDSVMGICGEALDIFERGIELEPPVTFSNSDEVRKLTYLYEANLGSEAKATRSAAIGIYSHHGNTPHGIRLAVEDSMRKGLIRFVVCTSTLAQGVNLPIRYLIMTGVYQGTDRIKVRDFHNLIGRAGRAGMHTEGSILFADPDLYDDRLSADNASNWRWREIKELLEAKNSEPCISSLLSLFEPIGSDNRQKPLNWGELDFAKIYITEPERLSTLAEFISAQAIGTSKSKYPVAKVQRQITERLKLIASIESFLLANWDTDTGAATEGDIVQLAKGTLAYFMADENTKALIVELFRLLAENILRNIPEPERRRVFGKTLYGIKDAQEIEKWLLNNLDTLSSCETTDEIFQWAWPLIYGKVRNSTFRKCDNENALRIVVCQWLEGRPFNELLADMKRNDGKLIWGKLRREFNIDQIVEICESGIAYDGALLIGALTEFAELRGASEQTIELLSLFQKMLKYGLPNKCSIALFELGFSDRVVAMDLASADKLRNESRKTIRRAIRLHRDEMLEIVKKYPSYFYDRVMDVVIS